MIHNATVDYIVWIMNNWGQHVRLGMARSLGWRQADVYGLLDLEGRGLFGP